MTKENSTTVSTKSRAWMVECHFLSGWGDTGWTEDDKPMRFKTKKEAEAEIDEFIKDCERAHRRGDMLVHHREQYRAVKDIE
jgi:hypothetical protein